MLGTPGGDLAELLVALAVYEGLAFTTLDAAAVKTMLKKFVGATKKRTLYFATSQAALLEIARRLRVDYLDVRYPPAALRQRLLEATTHVRGDATAAATSATCSPTTASTRCAASSARL